MTYKSVVVCGSVRPHGVSMKYAKELQEHLVNELSAQHEEVQVDLWANALNRVVGCIGCERCREEYECVFHDDMDALMNLMNECDELHVVCPVYFAGPPSKFKATLDRLQPYWERRIGPHALKRRDDDDAEDIEPLRCDSERRPLEIYVIGAGGDPYGYDALVTIISSAFGSSGFKVREVHDLIGWCQESEEAFRV